MRDFEISGGGPQQNELGLPLITLFYSAGTGESAELYFEEISARTHNHPEGQPGPREVTLTAEQARALVEEADRIVREAAHAVCALTHINHVFDCDEMLEGEFISSGFAVEVRDGNVLLTDARVNAGAYGAYVDLPQWSEFRGQILAAAAQLLA